MATSNYLGIDIRTGELERLVSDRLGRPYGLTPVGVKCTYPVFHGRADGGPDVFVKIGPNDEWRRTACLLQALADTGLVPRVLVGEGLDYRGFAVSVTEWSDVHVVFPEDMTEAQMDSFVAGTLKLAHALQGVTDYEHVDGTPTSPERLYAELLGYAKRHPWCSRAFSDLLSVPAERRTFDTRKRAVIHGDYHAKNFGFRGDAFAAVFDFGQVCDGLPCGDMVNALVERFSCLSMDARTRRRLKQKARDVFARVPWAKDEMEVAVNLLRLRFAARRIAKHPNALWVAFDIARRDRKICEILPCMEVGR